MVEVNRNLMHHNRVPERILLRQRNSMSIVANNHSPGTSETQTFLAIFIQAEFDDLRDALENLWTELSVLCVNSGRIESNIPTQIWPFSIPKISEMISSWFVGISGCFVWSQQITSSFSVLCCLVTGILTKIHVSVWFSKIILGN